MLPILTSDNSSSCDPLQTNRLYLQCSAAAAKNFANVGQNEKVAISSPSSMVVDAFDTIPFELQGKIYLKEWKIQPHYMDKTVYFKKTDRAKIHQNAELPKIACLCCYFML